MKPERAPAGAPPNARPTRMAPTAKEVSVRKMLEDGAKDFLTNLNFTGAAFPGQPGPPGPQGPAGTGGVITIPPGGGAVGPTLIFNDSSVAAMTANAAGLQAAITTASAGSRLMVRIVAPIDGTPPIVYLNAGLSFDLYKMRGLDGGGVTLDFSAMADGSKYMTLTSSRIIQSQTFWEQSMCLFTNFIAIGNGRNGTSRLFDIFTSYIKFERIFAYSCGFFEYLNPNAYLLKHTNVHAYQCGVMCTVPNPFSLPNIGEGIDFDGCHAGVCNQFLQTDCPEGEIHFVNGSIDFLSGPIVQGTSGRVSFSDCNLEGNSSSSTWFVLQPGQQGQLRFRGCTFIYDGATPSAANFMSVASTWEVSNDRPFMNNFRFNSDVLVSGTGAAQYTQSQVQFYGSGAHGHMLTDHADSNILADGDFALSAVNESDANLTSIIDRWEIRNDLVTPNHPYRGKSHNLFITDNVAPSGQTHCLEHRFVDASAFRVICCFVPVKPFARYAVGFQSARSAELTGSFGFTASWMEEINYGVYSTPRAQATIDWPSIAAGATATGSPVTVTGAIMGGPCEVIAREPGSIGIGTALIFWGIITSNDTVTPYAFNPTTGAIDMGSDTFQIYCPIGRNMHQNRGRTETESGFSLTVTPTTSFAISRSPVSTAPFPRAPAWSQWLYLQFNSGGTDPGGSITYGTQTGNFTVGQTVTGATSGAHGVIVTDTDAGATGTLLLKSLSGTFQNGEIITDPLGGSATTTSLITLSGSVYLGDVIVQKWCD